MSNDQSIPSDLPEEITVEDITFLLESHWYIHGKLMLLNIAIDHLFEVHLPCQQAELLRRIEASVEAHYQEMLTRDQGERIAKKFQEQATEFLQILKEKHRYAADASAQRSGLSPGTA